MINDLKIINRSNKKIDFNKEKIIKAIAKAVNTTNEFSIDKIYDIVDSIVNNIILLKEIKIDDIQNLIEIELINRNYYKTAKAYILYRDKRDNARNDKRIVVDVNNTINEYLNQEDWRVKANANQDYSLGGLILNTSGKVTANYWLNFIYPTEVKDAHINGDLHIHDLDIFAGYCSGWSLKNLLLEGLNGVKGKIESYPAKHLTTVISQIVNFFGTLQNEWAGAQAFSSFDTYLAPFIKVDNLEYKEVKQLIQQFVFNINIPSRWGGQTCFSNITLDWVCPYDLKDKKAIIGGEEVDFTYGSCQKEMDMINKAFLEVMTEGDMSGRIFTFPIPTYNITEDFNWDCENSELLFKMTAKYGTPYFQNFINSTLNPSDTRSMCCRLRLDLRELRNRGGALFGSSEMTGSVGVVTLNLARIGYTSNNKEEYFNKLLKLMDIAKTSLEIKRKVITNNIDRGFLPYTKRYLYSLHNYFSTIGINGMNESCLNFINKDIASEEGRQFAIKVLDFIRDKISEYQVETGNLYNLEATPAEATTYRFAKEDKKRYKDIKQAGNKKDPYYTNSTQLPVDYTDDLFLALQHQEELQCKYTGGTVFHCYLGEKIPNWESCRDLVKKIAYSFRIPYFTITPTFSICPSHGYLDGEQDNCPKCGNNCEVWSRVMGYFRPKNQFNKGKLVEFNERRMFKI